MNTTEDTIKFLMGKIDSLTNLTISLAEQVSLEALTVSLKGIERISAEKPADQLNAYELGYIEMGRHLAESIKTAQGARKTRDLSGPAQH